MPRLRAFSLALLCAFAQAEPQKVTLQLKWKHQWQFAGFYTAQAEGYYRAEGLEVSFLEAPAVGSPADVVLRGDAHFGIAASDLILLRAQGKPVVSLAAIYQHSPLVILTLPDQGITRIQDMANRRLALEPHAEELLAYLEASRVPRSSLQILSHTFTPLALLQGEVDAISAYSTDEPFSLSRDHIPYLTLSPRSAGIDFYGDVLFTTDIVVKRHPDLVAGFLRASLKGWRRALAHPEAAADLILAVHSRRHSREHLLFEAAQTRPLVLPDRGEIGQQSRERWRHIAETYQNLGVLKAIPDLQTFVYEPPPSKRRGWHLAAGLAGLVGLAALAWRVFRSASGSAVSGEPPTPTAH